MEELIEVFRLFPDPFRVVEIECALTGRKTGGYRVMSGSRTIAETSSRAVAYALAALTRARQAPEGEGVTCSHDPYHGKCVHCGVAFHEGHPIRLVPVTGKVHPNEQ